MSNIKCDFCGKKESDNNPIIAGNDVYICRDCIIAAYEMINPRRQNDEPEEEPKEVAEALKVLPPKELKAVLDDYVIGQEKAKKVFSVAVYNHYKRVLQAQSSDDDTEITKSNILLIGPTGSGKTLMAQTLAQHLNIPIAICDATSLTEAGYVGEDVENILTRLIQEADGDIERAQKGIVFIDEIDKISRLSENRSITRDVSGEGVQQALLKIIEGALVNVPPKGGRKHPNQDFLQIDTKDILFICGGAFDGLSDIIERRIGGNVLGFHNAPQTQTPGVKKGKSDKGAPSKPSWIAQVEPDDLVSYGLIPELIGRLHMFATLDDITKEAMIEILQKPKNALVKQYQKLFAIDDAKLTFKQEALEVIADLAIARKTGARGLRAILEDIMLDIMYELPELAGYEVIITPEAAKKESKPLLVKQKKQTKKSA